MNLKPCVVVICACVGSASTFNHIFTSLRDNFTHSVPPLCFCEMNQVRLDQEFIYIGEVCSPSLVHTVCCFVSCHHVPKELLCSKTCECKLCCCHRARRDAPVVMSDVVRPQEEIWRQTQNVRAVYLLTSLIEPLLGFMWLPHSHTFTTSLQYPSLLLTFN